MAHSAIHAIIQTYAATAEPDFDAPYLRTFEGDNIRRETTAFHLRRVRMDQTRSSAARHVAIERHNQRRAKQYRFSN